MDIEEALTIIGFGKFHYKLIAVCALSLLSVGIQSNVSSYAFSAAQCELNLTLSELGYLNVSYLFGNSISSFFWGILADNLGRRPILIVAHLLNVLVSFTSVIFQNVSILIFGRFLNGFVTSAPGSVIFSYLSEFQPIKYRSSVMCFSGLFFTSAYLVLPLVAWLILPLNIFVSYFPFVISSWRILIMILVIPELITGLWLLRFPDTPKYFLAKGDNEKALHVLDDMFMQNKGPFNKMPRKNLIDTKFEANLHGNSDYGKITLVIRYIFGQFRRLFQAPLLVLTLLTCAVSFSSLFGLFGLGLWLPELFIRFEKFESLYPNSTISISQLTKFKIMNNNGTNYSCEQSLEPSVITSTMVIGVVSLLSSGLAGWLATKITLRLITFVCLLIGSISALLIYWMTSAVENLIVAATFQATMIVGNVCIGGLVADLFPTEIAAMTLALVMFSGRIGAMISNIVFGLFMNDYCEIPIFVVAICLFIGACLCYMIPHRRDKIRDVTPEIQIEISVINCSSSVHSGC